MRRVRVAAVLVAAVLAGCQSGGAAPGPSPTPDAKALAELATLQVKGRAAKTGYSRATFGPAWTDDNNAQWGRNGCDTRNDILRRDLTAVQLKTGTNGCVVLTGTLHDPYTGVVIAFHRGASTSSAVQIDHVVALSDAWQKGAQYWDLQKRVDLANDPLELLAVDGPTNQAKGTATRRRGCRRTRRSAAATSRGRSR